MNVSEIITLNEALPDGWSMVRNSEGLWQAMDPDGTVRASGRIRGTVMGQAERYAASATPRSTTPSSSTRPAAPGERVWTARVDDAGNMEIEFEDGTKAKTSKPGDYKSLAEDIEAKVDPEYGRRIREARASRLGRLKEWVSNTKIYKWLKTLSGMSVLATLDIALSVPAILEMYDEYVDQRAALDAIFRINEVRSASQQEAYNKAHAAIWNNLIVAGIVVNLVELIVVLLLAGRRATRIVRALFMGIPVAGWIATLIVTVIVEGGGYLASRYIQRYGPRFFTEWFMDDWESAPTTRSEPIPGPEVSIDLNPSDFDPERLQQDRNNGIDVDAVQDRINSILNQRDADSN